MDDPYWRSAKIARRLPFVEQVTGLGESLSAKDRKTAHDIVQDQSRDVGCSEQIGLSDLYSADTIVEDIFLHGGSLMPDFKNHPCRFIAVLVVLLLAATVWLVALPRYQQHIAIQEIERLEGRIEYVSTAPDWLVDMGGDVWLRKVGIELERVRAVSLSLSGGQVTDDTMQHIGNFSNLELLDLRYSEFTDAGLVHLANLTNLEELELNDTDITDAGLVHLANLSNLEQLYLLDTEITDDGLGHLANLANLDVLSLRRTKVTDEGVRLLQESLPNCNIHR